MFRIQLSLVPQWIRVWRQSTKPFGRFSFFSRPQSFPSCCTFQVVDVPVVLVALATPRSCRQRQFVPKAGSAGFDAPQLCSSLLLQAQDARHLGRYGPGEQLQ